MARPRAIFACGETMPEPKVASSRADARSNSPARTHRIPGGSWKPARSRRPELREIAPAPDEQGRGRNFRSRIPKDREDSTRCPGWEQIRRPFETSRLPLRTGCCHRAAFPDSTGLFPFGLELQGALVVADGVAVFPASPSWSARFWRVSISAGAVGAPAADWAMGNGSAETQPAQANCERASPRQIERNLDMDIDCIRQQVYFELNPRSPVCSRKSSFRSKTSRDADCCATWRCARPLLSAGLC